MQKLWALTPYITLGNSLAQPQLCPYKWKGLQRVILEPSSHGATRLGNLDRGE